MSTEVVILIPVYRSTPEWHEEVSVKQAINVLHKYDHILLIPKGLPIGTIEKWYDKANKNFRKLEFDSSYFLNTHTYNQLILSEHFYQSITQYSYHLIYQTDAFIFRDELAHWCRQGFDYVGAPWIDWIHASKWAKNQSRWHQLLWLFGKRRFDAVGNGGFSLRNTKRLQSILKLFQRQASSFEHNEDFFFAFESARLGQPLQMPSVQQALAFAFDERPELAWKMNQQRLPMGCHGWHNHLSFWSDRIPLNNTNEHTQLKSIEHHT